MARLTNEIKVWREIPDDPDKARIEIKYLKPGEKRDIEDQIQLYEAVMRPNGDGAMQREIKINPAKGDKRYAYLCAAVTSWENFFEADGVTPMPCTDENKIRMARDDETFSPLIGQFRDDLAETVAADREAARKNS